MNTIEAIITHGLAIRQIPEIVYSLYYVHPRLTTPPGAEILVNPSNGREMYRTARIPSNAGYWMCQKCTDTSATMNWNLKKHHLAKTLEESVQMYLDSL